VTDDLSVLHWNVHSWQSASGASNAARVAALIRDTSPDVVSLVEVNEPWGAPATLASVAADCGYSWTFVPSIELDRPGGRRGYGNALLSRLPLSAVQQVDVFSAPGGYAGPEESETRSVLLARTGTGFWVGSTHFPASLRSARQSAASALGGLLRQLGPPWIVAGDFNAGPSLFPDGGTVAAGPTFPADRVRKEIDYFLVSPDVSGSASVLPVAGSDHLPVLITAARR
jgi:endonuclease/exonuclease/phosphatase family metal-dependent hydrolase